MKITYQELIDLEACEEQRERFFKYFGNELELPTELQAQKEMAAQMLAGNFDLGWCRDKLLCSWQNCVYKDAIEEDEFNYWASVSKARLSYSTYYQKYGIDSTPLWQEYCTIRDELSVPFNEKKWLTIIQILTDTLP